MDNLSTALRAVHDGLVEELALHGSLIPKANGHPKRDSLFASQMLSRIPADHPVRALTSLDEIQEYVEQTQLIAIDGLRANAVPGEGNPRARLVIVGEAPGADEDRQGRPFVGRSGKLLDKMLAAIGLDRKDLFITNILKTRPPKNRNPRPEEIVAHISVLYRQLSLIQPRIILCLGKVAGATLLRTKKSLGSMRGQAHDYWGITLMVTYHPSALLRNPQWKRPAWSDLQELQRIYTETGIQ